MNKTKNKISDVNEYLFKCLDTITNDDLTDEQLEKEINRSETVTRIAKAIIDSGNLALNVKKHMDEYGQGQNVNIELLGVEDEEK